MIVRRSSSDKSKLGGGEAFLDEGGVVDADDCPGAPAGGAQSGQVGNVKERVRGGLQPEAQTQRSVLRSARPWL